MCIRQNSHCWVQACPVRVSAGSRVFSPGIAPSRDLTLGPVPCAPRYRSSLFPSINQSSPTLSLQSFPMSARSHHLSFFLPILLPRARGQQEPTGQIPPIRTTLPLQTLAKGCDFPANAPLAGGLLHSVQKEEAPRSAGLSVTAAATEGSWATQKWHKWFPEQWLSREPPPQVHSDSSRRCTFSRSISPWPPSSSLYIPQLFHKT